MDTYTLTGTDSHININTYIHTYMHTYIHTYIHTHTHTYLAYIHIHKYIKATILS
jgi:hypothetical protein